MATGLVALRRKAQKAGVTGFRSMSRVELEKALDGGAPRKSKKAKPAVKRAPAGKKPAVRGTAKRRATSERKPTGRKPGRPKGSTTKPKATPKVATGRGRGIGSNGGRHMIEKIDFSRTDGWNPREGSPVDLIFRSLKKHKGNVDKTVAELSTHIRDFVPLRKANGEKRKPAEQRDYLRWKIQRVKFDFVTKTGQHKPSTKRAKYGTGGTGEGAYKPKAAPRGRKPAATKGRKPATRKATTRKPVARKRGKK